MSQSDLDQMTPDELAAGIAQVLGTAPRETPAPLPAGVDRTALTPEGVASVSDAWVSGILRDKAPNTWTPDEVKAVEAALGRYKG